MKKEARRVAFFTPDLSGNSLGRTYSLWELAQSLGWESTVVAARGNDIWVPLAGTEFASQCHLVREEELHEFPGVAEANIFIAVKPLDDSFGRAMRVGELLRTPLLLDIDDPDLEASLSLDNPLRRAIKRIVRRKSMKDHEALRVAAVLSPTIVSNPVLQARYGGPVIPHIRIDMGIGNPHTSRAPIVAFVGSNRGHKGVRLLREAVARCQDLNYTLVVTDEQPADGREWETWRGHTSLEEGCHIVGESDVVVIPSLDVTFARGQLPAKLMDAMLLGRAVAVSDIEPMPWALGGTGILLKPGSVDEIEAALRTFADPQIRSEAGVAARDRALGLFTAAPYRASFNAVVSETIAAYRASTHAS